MYGVGGSNDKGNRGKGFKINCKFLVVSFAFVLLLCSMERKIALCCS